MTIEVLFPDLNNLYGDTGNLKYLNACCPGCEILYTENTQPPRFLTQKVDMILMGSMSERKQAMAASRLLPYARQLRELIESGVVFLATGNTMELFGQYIAQGNERIPGLGIFPFHARRDMGIERRHNSMFLGKFQDMKIVGYRSQFSWCYGDFPHPFIQVTGGFGIYPEATFEGIHYRNFFGTYLLGPFLALNPLFTKYLLRLLGQDDTLAFEQQAMEAYEYRLKGLETPGVRFLMGEHG